MDKRDKMFGRQATYLDYVENLIQPYFRPLIVGLPPPPIDGIVCLGMGSEKVFIYVENESVAKKVQATLDEEFSKEKDVIEVKIIGSVVPAI